MRIYDLIAKKRDGGPFRKNKRYAHYGYISNNT